MRDFENLSAEVQRSSSTDAPIRAFFVGDNRTNVNWGRGASIALRQLLSSCFEISGSVEGELFNLSTAEVGYVGTLMPPRYYRVFRHLLLKRKRRLFSWYVKLEEAFGAKDFIDENPSLSVDNLLAHKQRYYALERIYDSAVSADIFVVDGDGDIILSNPPRRQTLFLLAMIELGIRLRKPVFLVNSMISDCPISGRNETTLVAARKLFGQCKALLLRDPESLEYVQKEMPETYPILIPDSLFAWQPVYANNRSRPPLNGDLLIPFPEQAECLGKLDFSEPYICIGGGALAATDPERSVKCYAQLVDAIKDLGYRVYLTENDSPDSFLHRVAKDRNVGIIPVEAPIVACGAVLAHAQLFISGRYHPSIFASLGGTPCIFMGSHAHKMGSLARVLEYEFQHQFDAFPSKDEIAEIVLRAQKYLAEGEALRAKIRAVAKSRCDEVMRLPAILKGHIMGQGYRISEEDVAAPGMAWKR
jgi:polysaccharide pyruvyl transferase WcaK-like protein